MTARGLEITAESHPADRFSTSLSFPQKGLNLFYQAEMSI